MFRHLEVATALFQVDGFGEGEGGVAYEIILM